MASESSLSEEDVSCPVCCDVFWDPVLLPCRHSFCDVCVRTWWREKGSNQCPICRSISPVDRPPCNPSLKNTCEAFVMDKHQGVCRVCHGTIDEAAQYHINEDILYGLRGRKLEDFNKGINKYNVTVEHIAFQTRDTESRINEQFKQLHEFLFEEEKARIAALREEQQQKSQAMKEMFEGQIRDAATLQDKIEATLLENLDLEDAPILFLNGYNTTVKMAQTQDDGLDSFTSQDPWLVSGTLIDVAKHLGNLTFNVVEKMKDIASYSPIILDPNSASSGTVLSDDLTMIAVETRRVKRLPENPERFPGFLSLVVASEGFASGIHSWEVEVGENERWTVGVVAQSFERQRSTGPLWHITSALGLQRNPRRIRVRLDWDGGKLSFFDPEANTHIHTFTHTFTEKLFPLVTAGSSEQPVKVLPCGGDTEQMYQVLCVASEELMAEELMAVELPAEEGPRRSKRVRKAPDRYVP